MGSLSTRTTHPYFVALFRQFLQAFAINTEIQTPYRFHTKGEMLANVNNQTVLAQTVKESMSCSHTEAGRYQGRTPGNHCGYCVPCIIRRASTSAAGLVDAQYDFDVLKDSFWYREREPTYVPFRWLSKGSRRVVLTSRSSASLAQARFPRKMPPIMLRPTHGE